MIVQFGGQTPLKLAAALEEAGVPILGTSPDAIDLAEDRQRFQQLLTDLGLRQPPNGTATNADEAEAIADRIGVINGGEILLVEDKVALMARMGKKKIRIDLASPTKTIPSKLKSYSLDLAKDGMALTYTYDTKLERTGITSLLNDLQAAGLQMRDVQTQQSSLEDIFVGLVQENTK